MAMLRGLSLIGGEYVTDASGKEFFAINPESGEALAPGFRAATPQQVGEAALAAEEAFASYRNVSATKRAAFLRTIADSVEAIVNDLVDRVHQETALSED